MIKSIPSASLGDEPLEEAVEVVAGSSCVEKLLTSPEKYLQTPLIKRRPTHLKAQPRRVAASCKADH